MNITTSDGKHAIIVPEMELEFFKIISEAQLGRKLLLFDSLVLVGFHL